jgi:hypothetical protein
MSSFINPLLGFLDALTETLNCEHDTLGHRVVSVTPLCKTMTLRAGGVRFHYRVEPGEELAFRPSATLAP